MSESTTTIETEHDVKLLELLRAEYAAKTALAAKIGVLRDMTDFRSSGERFGHRKVADRRPLEEVLATFTAIVNAGPDGKFASGYYCYGDRGAQHLAEFAERNLAAHDATEAVKTHEAAYTGWPRFWLVTSSPGHVHATMACSSCRPSTTFALVPTLSGKSENEAVEMLGETMCSVCFPSAPTGLNIPKAVAEAVGTAGFEKALAKWREREAEKVRKLEADKAAGRRKRPRKSPYVSMAAHMRAYPVEEGWY